MASCCRRWMRRKRWCRAAERPLRRLSRKSSKRAGTPCDRGEGRPGYTRLALRISQIDALPIQILSVLLDFSRGNWAPWYKSGVMRMIRWFPLTFLAGAHGFAIFAPYAALVLVTFHVARTIRKARLARA